MTLQVVQGLSVAQAADRFPAMKEAKRTVLAEERILRKVLLEWFDEHPKRGAYQDRIGHSVTGADMILADKVRDLASTGLFPIDSVMGWVPKHNLFVLGG